jgi:thiamine-phosphate pyrophosphorylase
LSPPRAFEGLYAVTPDALDPATLLARVEAVLAGGARALQYRRKGALEPQVRATEARALAAACRRYRAWFIVNDDVALAAAVGADGVHVGRDDADCAVARATLGPDAIVGVSCYDRLERALDAARAGATYVAFGAMHASGVKPQAVRAPLDLLARARQAVGCPVVAIGGITLERAPPLLAAGADALAVITDLFEAADPQARAAAYAALWPHTVPFNDPGGVLS